MRKYSVYIHTNKINGKRYIGVTTQIPEYRWRNGDGYKKQPYFYSAIQKYGWDNFDHFILEVGSEELMYQLEQQYIEYYQTTNREKGYNISLGGDGGRNIGKNSSTKDYFNLKRREYHSRHKKDDNKRSRDYYHTHREKMYMKGLEYYHNNVEKETLRHKKYYELHKDEINARRRELRKEKKQKEQS